LTPRDKGLPWSQHFKDYQAERTHCSSTTRGGTATPAARNFLHLLYSFIHFSFKRLMVGWEMVIARYLDLPHLKYPLKWFVSLNQDPLQTQL